MIKSVAQAIPTYLMSCFRIPKGVVDKIRAAIMRFWWGQKGDEKRTHWIRWEELCRPKWEGGLGLRDLAIFNLSLLAKQDWRLLKDGGLLLARTLKARYFPHGNFQEATKGHNPSYTWLSILDGREVLEHGLVWVVGRGSEINIWRDPWLVQHENSMVSTEERPEYRDTVVRDLIADDYSGWNIPLVNEIFNQVDAAMILSLPCSPLRDDRLTWKHEKTGVYSTKSGYIEMMKASNLGYTSTLGEEN